ncbi:MAG TPA: phenylalanine--tRNA ligase subunit beta, partial [Actinobacteria bacterium]|nr:phenylalanine--tRNA ligase subunit beta [Actinomycetota bacterium]
MRVTLDWLRDFVDLPEVTPEELVEVFESLGLEVEAWEPISYDLSGVVVGRVVEIRPHPDADRVRVCTVDVGEGLREIVCGAWNFEAGAVVPVALPGAELPGGLRIDRRTIRGVESEGMICSEAELGLGEDETGILVLDRDYPWAGDHVGAPLQELLPRNDAVFEIDVTPNRPDCMSVWGLARELAAYYDLELRAPRTDVDESGPPSAVTVHIEDPAGCPRFVAREVRDLEVGPSPHWMRRRLQLAGVRPISNVVDASNYAMLEVGHPTHAFDLDRLGTTIVVRRARPGERIVTLDDVERTLDGADLVVADADRPVAVAGVMGGADTEVGPETTRVVVEAAYWDPPSVLMTSKRLGLRTEASARFERGMDPNFCDRAADRVAHLLQEIAGGRPAPPLVDAYPRPIEPKTVSLPAGEVERVLGAALDVGEIATLLRRLHFDVIEEGAGVTVTVPTRRPDVTRPIDLVEEVARLHGFERLPERLRLGTGAGLPARERLLRRIREVLVGAGYHEIASFSIVSHDDLVALGLPEGNPVLDAVSVANPLNE